MKRTIEVLFGLLILAIAVLPILGQEAKPASVARLDQPVTVDYTLPEIRSDGKSSSLQLARVQGEKNLVLFFFSEQCGVTFFYKSRIQQLQREFEAKGFVFLGVRAGKKEKPQGPVEIAETNYLSMPFVDDARGELMRYFQVRQSVTFAVIDRANCLRYQGAFDDNVNPKRVKRNYLPDALRSLTQGKPVAVKQGQPLGCAILPLSL